MAFRHRSALLLHWQETLIALIRKERHGDAAEPHSERFAVLSCDFCRDMARFKPPLIGFPVTNCYTLQDEALAFSAQMASKNGNKSINRHKMHLSLCIKSIRNNVTYYSLTIALKPKGNKMSVVAFYIFHKTHDKNDFHT